MRTLEIFSGTGGLAKGLENAGFEHASFVEINNDACLSLCQNFGDNLVFNGDIKDFDLSSIGEVDVVAGGPPCQPFSLGGKHQANHDSRDMFPYAIRTIETLKPKAFVFENVKGLLRIAFAEYFEYIILRLSFPSYQIKKGEDWIVHLARLKDMNDKGKIEPEYNVKYKLVNAADYGVPQTRERVFIVGFRADLNINYSFPKKTHAEDRLLWELFVTNEYYKKHDVKLPKRSEATSATKGKYDYITNKYCLFEPECQPWKTVRDTLWGVPDPREKHDIPDHIFRDGARSYWGHTGSELDWPAKTIKAGGHGVPGGENMIRFADGTVRYFTVFEAKRIQTFPDDFIIKGAWGEAMRQIGNAVPVLLGEIIGKTIIASLTIHKKQLRHTA